MQKQLYWSWLFRKRNVLQWYCLLISVARQIT